MFPEFLLLVSIGSDTASTAGFNLLSKVVKLPSLASSQAPFTAPQAVCPKTTITLVPAACKLAGTKVIVVLGHTACGAVKGACDDAKLGNLTSLLSKLKPAVEAVPEPTDTSKRNSGNIEFVNNVAEKNVYMTIANIRAQSPVLEEMEKQGEIKIVGAMYDIKDGSVTFYE